MEWLDHIDSALDWFARNVPPNLVGAIVLGLIALVCAVKHLGPLVPLWLRARRRNLPVTAGNLLGSWLRRTDPAELVEMVAFAEEHRLGVTFDQLETVILAAGRPERPLNALKRARELRRSADFDLLTSIDLAGFDAERLVETRIDLRAVVGSDDPRLDAFRRR